MPENIIFIADDLTGACDTASFICDFKDNVKVFIDFFEDGFDGSFKNINDFSDFNLVISTNTRDTKEEITYLKLQKLSDLLKNTQAKSIFKKIDSAFRGNVVFEINKLMDLLNVNICFVINAIPSMGRITLGGFQLINGNILNDSEFGKDPVSIAGSSYIPHLFLEKYHKSCLKRSAHVLLETIRYGDIFKTIEAYINKGINIVSFDSVKNEDIEKIINNVYEKFGKTLYVGTLGLLMALNKKIFNESNSNSDYVEDKYDSKLESKNKKYKKNKFNIAEKFIGFTSSKYEITKRQIKLLNKKYGTEIIKIRINDFLNKKDSDYILEIQNYSSEIIKKFSKNGLFIITEFKGKNEPENLSKKILKIISDIAYEILNKIEFRRLILIGGETGFNILKSLQVKTLKIMGRVSDGISYGLISDGLIRNKELILKGGSVGDINSIINMVNFEF
ncbi:MAG: four-carbon acid sugar kinase family protein [Actinobacteria bacterium]|nr:four-carbon acid sugar kinase family protein [Cyanobacteriota bacterium]MCL5771673.1 four-carbon acid sugar kinase family protein [Actinomycetota bacterium]